MASQISHIVYADIVNKKILQRKNINRSKYFIGNVFPDIRYLGCISRDETHANDPRFSKMQKVDNSFHLGMHVHALVDWEREKLIQKLGLYNFIEKNHLNSLALKLLEDEITFNLFKNWSEIIEFLDQIYIEEKIVPIKYIEKWHGLLKKYFLKERSSISLADDIGFDKNSLILLEKNMNNYRNNELVMNIIETIPDKLFS